MTHTCPTCDRALKKVDDYPLIVISNFERLAIPEIIPHALPKDTYWDQGVDKEILPEPIKNLFAASGKDTIVHEGMVYQKRCFPPEMHYYECSHDVTAVFHEVFDSSLVQDQLKALEQLVGKEITRKELLSFPGFNQYFSQGDYSDFRLWWGHPIQEGDFSKCNIALIGMRSGGTISVLGLHQDVAQLTYQGKLRNL